MVRKVTRFLQSQAKRMLAMPVVRKALHTFWQTFVAVLLVGFVSVRDFETALALVVAACAAGLSAVKTVLVRRFLA